MHFYIYNARNLQQDMDLHNIAGKALRKAKLGSLRLKQSPRQRLMILHVGNLGPIPSLLKTDDCMDI